MADPKHDPVTAAALAEKEKRETRAAELAANRAAEREKRQGETKADAFRRIANMRTTNALGALATLASTFDKNNYDFTAEQADKIMNALRGKLSEVQARANGEAKAKESFTL